MSRIVIVGGGIIGLCSAHELLQRGHTVTVVDRSFSDGCSYGNGGIIVPSHFVPIASPGMVRLGLKMMFKSKSPFGLAATPDFSMLTWMAKFLQNSTASKVAQSSELIKNLNLQSRALYECLISELRLEAGFAKRGLLMICRTPETFHEEVAFGESAQKLGLKTSVCSKGDLAAMEPNVPMEAAGGVLFEDDAHLTPRLVMDKLKTYLAEKGVTLRQADVLSVTTQNETIQSLKTRDGEIEADSYIFCGGVWTGDLAQSAGLNLPMLSGRGYGITLPADPSPWKHPAILVESRIAVTPMTDGTRFVGAMELGHPTERPIGPRFEGMVEGIPRYYPKLSSVDLKHLPVWTGHRPCTPDGLPYLGKSAKFKNAIWAAGHAMMGMSLGPISGKIVAQISDGEPSDYPLEQLSPDRYAK